VRALNAALAEEGARGVYLLAISELGRNDSAGRPGAMGACALRDAKNPLSCLDCRHWCVQSGVTEGWVVLLLQLMAAVDDDGHLPPPDIPV
jgi:hypothetical protein